MMALLVTKKLNAEWHRQHQLPKNSAFEQRVTWHLQHQRNCACRPVPKKLLEEMKRKGIIF
jgi:hypothetical protein